MPSFALLACCLPVLCLLIFSPSRLLVFLSSRCSKYLLACLPTYLSTYLPTYPSAQPANTAYILLHNTPVSRSNPNLFYSSHPPQSSLFFFFLPLSFIGRRRVIKRSGSLIHFIKTAIYPIPSCPVCLSNLLFLLIIIFCYLLLVV